MCGIIAYLGDGDAPLVLLQGLKRMEVRSNRRFGWVLGLVMTGEKCNMKKKKNAGETKGRRTRPVRLGRINR